MSETLLVTGAAGFIGSHLTRSLLAEGHTVFGVDNLDPFYDCSIKRAALGRLVGSFEFVEADICDAGAMLDVCRRARPTTIYHFAALAGVRPSIAEPARYARVNVGGLISILDAARSADCRRFVFASSSSVYGNNRKVPFAECDPVDEPISPYAATKRAGELICHTYSHLFGIHCACLRFFTVFGEGQRPDLAIARFMRLMAAGEPIPRFGDGSSSRDYTYVDDIIQGVHAAQQRLASLDDDAAGFLRTWNLGGDSPVTLRSLIELIAAVTGHTPRIDEQPMQPGDVDRTWADLTRSREELGYQPRTSFEEGLRKQWSACAVPT